MVTRNSLTRAGGWWYERRIISPPDPARAEFRFPTKGETWFRYCDVGFGRPSDRFVRHENEYLARKESMHLNPVRKGLVRKLERWRWSSYDNFALNAGVVKGCPIQIDYIRLPEGYRG